MSRTRFSTVAVAFALVLAACGGGSNDETATTGGAEVTTTAVTETTAGGGGSTASITIVDFTFEAPDSIAAGTPVTVSNEDGVAHTFTSEDDLFDSGSIAAGESFEFTFDEAGEYAYFCKFHPQMTGTLTVEG